MTDMPFDVTRWIETHFAKGKIPPFSFVYDGKPSRELLKKWKYTAARVESDEPEAVEYLYTYLDRSTGLQVECRVKGFTDFDAVEWVLNFKNDSQANSASISQVKVVDLDFEYPQKGNTRKRAISSCITLTEAMFRSTISTSAPRCLRRAIRCTWPRRADVRRRWLFRSSTSSLPQGRA